jgi:hypothetical protein
MYQKVKEDVPSVNARTEDRLISWSSGGSLCVGPSRSQTARAVWAMEGVNNDPEDKLRNQNSCFDLLSGLLASCLIPV